jgi:hypothetical protein
VSAGFDKVVAETDQLDERLSLSAPVCILCGKHITRLNFVTFESPAFTARFAHQECADAIGDARTLAERVWASIVAATRGQAEAPTPAPARVRGGFL